MDNTKIESDNQIEEQEIQSPTCPTSFPVITKGFETKESGELLGQIVGEFIIELSRIFDLNSLDGVTIAFDYNAALIELDRGYTSSYKLSPTEGEVFGVAMTPTVTRNGIIKSHIVLNANFVQAIQQFEGPDFKQALHIIAHECAHVEINNYFDTAFPNILLQPSDSDLRLHYRWDAIFACWNEYAATRRSASIGAEQTEDYEETFLKRLAHTRNDAINCINLYRFHGNLRQVLAEVYLSIGELLKFAAYHLGNLDGLQIPVEDRPRTTDALKDNWFAPYFFRLHDACQEIAAHYGSWTDQALFEIVGDLVEDLFRDVGIYFRYPEPDQLYVDIPYAASTAKD